VLIAKQNYEFVTAPTERLVLVTDRRLQKVPDIA